MGDPLDRLIRTRHALAVVSEAVMLDTFAPSESVVRLLDRVADELLVVQHEIEQEREGG